MDTNALSTKLRNFAPLSSADEAIVAGFCHDTRVIAHRHQISGEGSPANRMHLILDGWAAETVTLRSGARQITSIMLPGDFCDLHTPLLERTDHGIVAITDCKLALVSEPAIIDATEKSPTLARAFWWSTLVDHAIARQWIVNNGRREAIVAVAHLLCELHARMEMIGLSSERPLHLPLTQEDLGDALGLTPIHVNRTLRRLREGGLVDARRRLLAIKKLSPLREFAGFDPRYLHVQRGCAPSLQSAA